MKRTKTELERYLGSLAWSLEIQRMKRPEEWVRYGGVMLPVLVGMSAGWIYALPAGLLVVPIFFALAKRRLKTKDDSHVLASTMENAGIQQMRRVLRKGGLETEIGASAYALLQSSATTANAIIAVVAQTHMTGGGGTQALKQFRPMTEAMETLMRAALETATQKIIFRRPINDTSLSRLREIDESLRTLAGQVERTANEWKPGSDLSAESRAAIESIRAREELLGEPADSVQERAG